MASLPCRVALGAGLVALMAAASLPLASAQPARKHAEPSDADRQEAKRLTKEGIAAQNAGSYDRAIALYKQAYAHAPHPVLLANIALAHRLAGHDDEALTYYERYLAADPNGSEAGPSSVAVKELKAAGATSKPDLDREPEATAEPPSDAAPAASSEEAPAPAPESPRPERASGAPGRSLRITGLALGGVGLATVAVGGIFGLRVRSLEADARDAANSGASQQMLEQMFKSDGDAAERRQFICYGVGAALVIGGAVTYWLGHRQGHATPTTAWTPLVGGGFAGVALTGTLR